MHANIGMLTLSIIYDMSLMAWKDCLSLNFNLTLQCEDISPVKEVKYSSVLDSRVKPLASYSVSFY